MIRIMKDRAVYFPLWVLSSDIYFNTTPDCDYATEAYSNRGFFRLPPTGEVKLAIAAVATITITTRDGEVTHVACRIYKHPIPRLDIQLPDGTVRRIE